MEVFFVHSQWEQIGYVLLQVPIITGAEERLRWAVQDGHNFCISLKDVSPQPPALLQVSNWAGDSTGITGYDAGNYLVTDTFAFQKLSNSLLISAGFTKHSGLTLPCLCHVNSHEIQVLQQRFILWVHWWWGLTVFSIRTWKPPEKAGWCQLYWHKP